MRRAILSVSDKSGLIPFGKALAARGFELVSTGGTAKALADAGLPVVNVSDVTGFPEMMDGRVKTLHPKIHGGILARRSHPEDLELAKQHGIGLVDLVVVNLYPFVETAAKPGIKFDDLIEQIDIGGPSLVRAASKNFHDVLIVVSPKDYDAGDSRARQGRRAVAGVSIRARHVAPSSTPARTTPRSPSTLGEVSVDGDVFERPSPKPQAPSPDRLRIEASKLRDLRYGENPHQPAAWYALDPPAGLGAPAVLQGKELSFTNLLDLDAAARIVARVRRAGRVGDQAHQPVRRRDGRIDRRSLRARARGGFAGRLRRHHRPQSNARRRHRARDRLDVHRSRDRSRRRRHGAHRSSRPKPTSASSSPISAGWPTRANTDRSSARCWCRSAIASSRRSCRGRPTGIKVVTKRQPTADEWQAMRFAWRVMAHVKSNTVIFTDAVRTLAIGAGQMSRVDAVKVAVNKAGGWKGGSAPIAQGIGGRIGCVLPVPRWARCRRRRRRHRGRAAGRIGEGRGGDRRRG